MAPDITLSQDELKILIQILNSLSFDLKDVEVILNIVKKLESEIKEPGLKVPVISFNNNDFRVKIQTKKL